MSKKIDRDSLEKLGWNDHFQKAFKNTRDDLTAARVIEVNRKGFIVNNGSTEEPAIAAGNFKVRQDGIYPVTGDWVLLKDQVIQDVLKRRNTLSRGASGNRKKTNVNARSEQIIAANLDTVFIVSGLDQDFNARRIERYLTLVYNCGLTPVIILTKGDLHQDPAQFAQQLEDIAMGVDIQTVSADDSESVEQLRKYLVPNQTISLIGSSGAGKSTLVNRLTGENSQLTGTVSDSVGKGRHTTTTRNLIRIPGGGMIIDNPGTREIAFWDDDGGLDNTFPEIDEFGRACRFSDCTHVHEPGCNVIEAVKRGELLPDRLDSYQKMRKELEYSFQRENKSSERIEKERWQHVAKKIKHIHKNKKKK